MSDDKEGKKEPTPGSKETGREKNQSETESDTTEATESDDDKQKKAAEKKPQQPEQSKQDLQRTESKNYDASKTRQSKTRLSEAHLSNLPGQLKPELPKLELPKPAFHPPASESPEPPAKKLSRLGAVLLRRPKEQPPVGDPNPGSQVKKKWFKNCYDEQNKMYCGRTCKSWMHILVYSIMYFIFLSTYTMMFLYVSLVIIKSRESYLDKTTDFQFLKSGVGLTATPTSEDKSPMIWYHKHQADEYQKYVNALERLINQRRKNDSNYKYLGPCGEAPFGYGDAPCVIVRINKNWGWKAKPLRPAFASDVPSSVRHWAEKDAKLWLNCGGHHPYDAEHIGSIKYFPDPPGFDPAVFPLARGSESPLIAVQFSNFTLGMSIVVECKLWYEDGTSAVDFVLFVDT